MEFFYAIVLGVVEGVTEFLPVSSTGHLILAERLLALPPSEFWKSFIVAIQLGAILAVGALYWRQLFLSRAVFTRVVVAFLPTAVIGLFLYPFIKEYLLGNTTVVLWALAVGGAAIVLFERVYREPWQAVEQVSRMSYRQALIIGLAQAVAVVPGVSRAAATIVGGLLAGLKRRTIVEFSFLLAIPTMAAATGLDLLETGTAFSVSEWSVLGMGFVVSFVFALAAVRWLLRYISRHTFTAFGWYRLALAAFYALFLLL
ncbi:MAG: undecaprenyl-diphosphate phosphatase [Candidatus Veblenbacteria bacterium]|nr:undecaprenyl-diphosphate phosphatase [Candidatus Veblenbacteria bacterium]MDZ4230156.1 undecaprenyl-diphosphate phosphatase [Candidatus Veblenbacteria bacterium]